MASGTIVGSFADNTGQIPSITWTSTPNVSKNESSVTVTFRYQRKSTGYTTHYAGASYSITINGSTKTGTHDYDIRPLAKDAYQTIGTYTVTVPHNSDGTKSISVSASINLSGTTAGKGTVSGTITLDKIARASSVSCPTMTIGSNVTISVTRASTSFTHKLTYKLGNATGTIASNVATSSTWTVPTSLYQYMTSASMKMTITCETYNGTSQTAANLIGSTTCTPTINLPANAKPSGSISYTSPTTSIVQGATAISITVTHSPFDAGSTVSKVAISFGGASASKTAGSGSTTFSITPTQSGTQKIVATITDSRGATTTVEVANINVVAYNIPVAYLSARRCTQAGVPFDFGSYVSITYRATFTDVNNNQVTGVLKFGTTTVNISDGNEHTNVYPADSEQTFLITLVYTDSYGKSSATKSMTLSKAFVLMDWSSDGTGMALGESAESNKIKIGNLQTWHGSDIVIDKNNASIYGVSKDGTKYKSNFQPVNVNNDCVVGYDNWRLNEGNLLLCGVNVELRTYNNSGWFSINGRNFGTNKVLWTGAWYMSYVNGSAQTAVLSEAVSKQPNGIVIVFSSYSPTTSTVNNWDWSFHFIPKEFVKSHNGNGTNLGNFHAQQNYAWTKYLYISDTQIMGANYNASTGTGANGIKYTNNAMVMREVIGV